MWERMGIPIRQPKACNTKNNNSHFPATELETWSGHSFTAPHSGALSESGHSQLGMLNNSGSASVWLILMSFLEIK